MYGEVRRFCVCVALLVFGLMLAPRLWAGDGNNNFRLAVTDAPDDIANSNVRDIISGSDLDRDGKYEIIITDYSYGGRAHVYEVVGDNMLEWVWSSPGTDSPEWAPTRAVQVADLDADGHQEILLSICQSGAAPGTAGLHVFEWDGVHNNGYGSAPIAVIPVDATVTGGFTEDFAVEDLDGDLHQEILYLNRGTFEWNRCYVLSIAGYFESSWSVITEAVYRQETGDLHGAPWDVVVSDLDGDGFKEAIYALRDGGAGLFIVEATGPNSYAPATTLHINPNNNGYSLEGMAAADVNDDEKDELYMVLHQSGGNIDVSGPLIIVTSGDDVAAMTFADNVHYLRDDGAGCYGLAIGDQDHGAGSDGPDIYVTSFGSESVGGFIQDFEFVGSEVRDPGSYIEHVIFQDLASAWPGGLFQLDIPRVDLDGDGLRELVVSYTGETATGVYFRIFEFDARTPTLSVGSPNGGEVFLEGSIQTISWSSENFLGGIKIEYSADGGNTWNPMAQYLPNSGSYDWRVPFTPTNNALVRISEAGAGEPSEVSNDYFTIVREVILDIKPGGFPNSINLKNKGVIPVAILTTASFDATTVDPISVAFGPNEATESHGKGHFEDVDGDGDRDMVLHFKTQDTGIQCGQTEATLIGETIDGLAITGTDAIQTVGCGTNKTMSEAEAGIPEGYALFQNHPNPFSAKAHGTFGIFTTEIRFALPEAHPVVLKIYNTLGEEIRTLIDAPFDAGYHRVLWDGKNNDGKPVASGVYLYQLRAGAFSQVRKMNLLR